MDEQDPSPRNSAKTDETGIDCISALPDSVIVEILSKIPITDACTTTILSKHWQYLWTCIHNLHCYRSNTGSGWSDKRLISFMDNALPLLTSSKIKSFTLHFTPNIALSNYHSKLRSKLHEWLEIVLKKKVENLDLDLWGCDYYLDSDLYSLPQELCSSSSLVKLKFKFCKIPEDRKLNWTSLKSLTLTFVLLTEEHMKQITSNCHHLESLKLCDFCGFHRLHLTSPKCTTLELSNHTHPLGYMGDECYFEIVAPYVQHFRISGNFDGVGIRLGDMSSLIHADLTYNLYDDRGLDDVIDKSIVKDHLTSVACANELIIPSLYIEMISMLILQKEDVSLPLMECKRLTINSWISKYTFLGIDRLLSSTPCLENLTIHLKVDCTFLNYWCEDMDELEDNYENIFIIGSLRNLKILKVILQWSPFIEDDTTTELTELMKCLFEHAKYLEKLVIVAETRDCSEVIQNLLALPRVSNSTVVVSSESVAGAEY
ncbi:putative F-box/LRR-repeat protein At5g02930 isoform X1 [Solanum tuberosum]|uniref:F-box family protein n=1 Tax=Solanum tuberosum TaxID=4113 RepID=M1BH13_SOLTU|nr:PREDICTED: putative F-box/LRR-repeat protein At5g02930 isoform X1 [Solanum tuberosum]